MPPPAVGCREGFTVKGYDRTAMRRLVRENSQARELFARHKGALKSAGPQKKGNLRTFARACTAQALKKTFEEVRDNGAAAALQQRYDAIWNGVHLGT
jgi:hypothetical protein